MPIFIDKAELLAQPVQVPGLVPPAQPFALGSSAPAAGGFDLGQIERILTQVNSIMGNGAQLLGNVHQMRMQAAALRAPLQAQPVAQLPAAELPRPPPPYPLPAAQTAAPPPQTPTTTPETEPPKPKEEMKPMPPHVGEKDILVPPLLNEAAARAFGAALIYDMGTAEQLKNTTCGQVKQAYEMLPNVRQSLDAEMTNRLRAWLPKLVSP